MTTQHGYGDPQTLSGITPYDENTDGFQAYINAAQEELTAIDVFQYLIENETEFGNQVNILLTDTAIEYKDVYNQLCMAIDKAISQRARQLEDAHILQQANDFEVKDEY